MGRKKIVIDSSACIGCGACAAVYADDIVINADGLAEAVTGECEESVVDECPTGAISVEE